MFSAEYASRAVADHVFIFERHHREMDDQLTGRHLGTLRLEKDTRAGIPICHFDVGIDGHLDG